MISAFYIASKMSASKRAVPGQKLTLIRVVLTIVFYGSACQVRASDDTIRTSAQAVIHDVASLPCDVDGTLTNDRPVLILWYKDAAGTPFYSFDAREIELQKGNHWSSESHMDHRAHFKFIPTVSAWSSKGLRHKFGAYLQVNPVEDQDQGVFRCRVDFLLSPTKNTIINFTVIIPPEKPEIYNATEHLVGGGPSDAHIIGPYNEGSQLILTCTVNEGRPRPRVEWLMNDQKVDVDSEYLDPQHITRSVLIIPRLTRDHLHTVFDCRASNFNRSLPTSTTVTLDMNFQPLNVTIINELRHLSTGSTYELVCQSWGSRPAAQITWWKGGTLEMKGAQLTTSPDSNITTSVLMYTAQMSDNQKYLTCRAENKLIAGSAKEDGIKLNISYKPIVTLQMGNELDPEIIKEGDDVYFECHINANPKMERVIWFHNGIPIEPKQERGVIESNQSLVLQNVKRTAGGFYTCRAVNMEGEGESLPVQLKVKYKPYCRKHTKIVYGTALHEPASVTCEVDANPGPVTFRWTFNNTSENLPIPSSAVISHEFTSMASYAPKSHLDYGTLLCWAFNEVGTQETPCAFTIIPAGPPDPPNCSIVNQTTDTIEVECASGFDGGLPQTFFMEVYDYETGTILYRNISSPDPAFLLTSLRSGLGFLMYTYSANSKGRSTSTRLETFTLKVAEKRTGPPSLFEFTPLLGILVGILAVCAISALIVMAAIKLRKPGGRDPSRLQVGVAKGEMENKPLNSRIRSKDVKGPSAIESCEPDESDPDVIPHNSDILGYSDYESIEKLDSRPYIGTSRIDAHPSVQIRPPQPNYSGVLPQYYPGVNYMDLARPLLTSSEECSLTSYPNVAIYATLNRKNAYPQTTMDYCTENSATVWTPLLSNRNESTV